MQKAVSHMLNADYQSSIIELKNVLSLDPDRTEARLLLGKAWLALGNGASAEKELRRAAQMGATSQALPDLIEAMFLQQKYAGVIETSNQIVGSPDGQDVFHALALRGRAQLREGDEAGAVRTLESVLERNPNDAGALVGMAEIRVARRDTTGARELLEQALKVAPANADAWSLVGQLELEEGDLEAAEEAFGRAIDEKAYVTPDLARRALVRVRQEKYDAAQQDLQRLRQAGFAEQPFVKFVEGYSLFRRRQYTGAEEAFQAALLNEPGFLDAQIYLATTHLALGNLELARSLANQAHYNAPNSLRAKRVYGATLIKDADYEAATRVLTEALEQSPDSTVVLRMLAAAALAAGHAGEAFDYYQRLAILEPDSTEIRDRLLVTSALAGRPLPPSDSPDAPVEAFLRVFESAQSESVEEVLQQAHELSARHPNDINPLKLIAAIHLRIGQWHEAKGALEKVLDIQPNEPSAARNLAKVLVREGDLLGAEDLLVPLVQEYPQDEAAVVLLAQIKAQKNGRSQAIQVLEEGLARHPNGLILRWQLAAERLRDGNAHEVLALTKGLEPEMFEQRPTLLEIQGKAQMLTGDIPAARSSFARLVELVPDSAPAHFLYSDALARSGQPRAASEQLAKAMEIDQQYLPARIGQVKILVKQNRLPEAREAVEDLRRDFDDRPEVLGIEGWLALGTGDFSKASERLSAAMEQKPERETLLLLIQALWPQKQYERAFALMEQWLKDHPQDLAVLLARADGLLSLGREQEARSGYRRVLEFYPDHVTALNNYAWLGRDVDPAEALPYAERAYERSPANQYVSNTLGTLLIETGQVNRGLEVLRAALRTYPDANDTRLMLARILVQEGQYAEAQKVLGPLIADPPNDESAEQAQALLDRASIQ